MMMILATILIFFSLRDSSTGIGIKNLSYYSSLSFYSYYSLILWEDTWITYYYYNSRSFFTLRALVELSLAVPKRITYLSTTAYYSTGYITTATSKSRRFSPSHPGRWAGVRLKQRIIRSCMPGENKALLSMGLRVGSKAGRSLVITLCRTNPNDHISIFCWSSLKKFSGRMMFSFI